ncbi:MAG: ORF6N domain-containing protein [Agriterribacter sp.]
MRSQFGTSSWGGTQYLPYAFTEHGVTMLANVLKLES